MTVKLIHGDCLEEMPKLAPSSIQMVFADLPYGQKTGAITANIWDNGFDLVAFWRCVSDIRSDSAATLLTAKMKFACHLICSNAKEFRHDLVWQKSRPTRQHHAHRMPLCGHEHVLVFAKTRHTYNPQMQLRAKPLNYGKARHVKSSNYNAEPNRGTLAGRIYTHSHPTTVLRIKSENGQIHPTQKPVALLDWLLRTYTNPGDTVLDPVAGSGATAIAALRSGRNAVCIEKDTNYFDLMSKRVFAEQQQMRLAI